MFVSIRKIFFNLKISLILLSAAIVLLAIELSHISGHGAKLAALKNQHLLIEKIVNTDLANTDMSRILIKEATAEIAFSVKLSGEESFLDSLTKSNEEQASLLRSLTVSSDAFNENAIWWSEAKDSLRPTERERLMNAKIAYLGDIARMSDFQIQVINEAISSAKMTVLLTLLFAIIVVYLSHVHLHQIYSDIEQANAVDTGTRKEVKTEEIDFLVKRLARRSAQGPSATALLHPLSGLPNEKGIVSVLNAKKGGKPGQTLFLVLFEIDHHDSLINSLSKEDLTAMYKKLSDIIGLYEQPFDVIGQIKNGSFIFLMSRNGKTDALDECERIVHSIEASGFSTERGPVRITASSAFLHKLPGKTVEDTIADATALVEKAKESGGNRIVQLRDMSI